MDKNQTNAAMNEVRQPRPNTPYQQKDPFRYLWMVQRLDYRVVQRWLHDSAHFSSLSWSLE